MGKARAIPDEQMSIISALARHIQMRRYDPKGKGRIYERAKVG